jgi:hypothetical protein
MSDIENALIENAQNPKKVSGDAGSLEQHALKDQIEAEKFLQSKKAAAGKNLGIRFVKIAPGGGI